MSLYHHPGCGRNFLRSSGSDFSIFVGLHLVLFVQEQQCPNRGTFLKRFTRFLRNKMKASCCLTVKKNSSYSLSNNENSEIQSFCLHQLYAKFSLKATYYAKCTFCVFLYFYVSLFCSYKHSKNQITSVFCQFLQIFGCLKKNKTSVVL